MKTLASVVIAIAALLAGGCESKRRGSDEAPASTPAQKLQATESRPVQANLSDGPSATPIGNTQPALSKASDVQASTQAADRKIIRNAELTIETDSPTEGLRRITTIAESHGGFVVTSDFKRSDSIPQNRTTQQVTVIARVPASQFDAAIAQIHEIGGVLNEKLTGQDVSEEYLDLEARVRSKKALEAQFLEIMKQARKVSDALEVQSQLADVRTEIERLEGRRRFLQNQSALSTITVSLQMPVPVVAATSGGFAHSIKQTFGDSADVTVWIVLTLIQIVIVLTPIAALVGVPAWIVWRVMKRRARLSEQPAIVPET